MRSIAICLAFSIGLCLASCDKPADNQLPKVTPPSGTDAAKTPPAAGKTDAALGEIKKATSSASDSAKEIAATAKDQLADAAAAISSAVTPEKLKEMAASATPEKLKEVADKILAALQDKEGVLKGLKDKLAALGAGDLTKAPEIKKEADTTQSLLTQLKDKLKIVVEQLKAKGIDISKYTAFLQ
jgi:hypothetical protein